MVNSPHLAILPVKAWSQLAWGGAAAALVAAWPAPVAPAARSLEWMNQDIFMT